MHITPAFRLSRIMTRTTHKMQCYSRRVLLLSMLHCLTRAMWWRMGSARRSCMARGRSKEILQRGCNYGLPYWRGRWRDGRRRGSQVGEGVRRICNTGWWSA